MPNGTGNFWNFQISRKKDNLKRWTKISETIFLKVSVPFDFEMEFPEILVEWNMSLAYHVSIVWPGQGSSIYTLDVILV